MYALILSGSEARIPGRLVTRAGAREKQSSQLLDAPPPLRLSQNLSLGHQQQESEPGSPSTEEEDNSAVFNPSQLASPMSGPASNLFKPTALKTDPCFLDRPTSQVSAPTLER